MAYFNHAFHKTFLGTGTTRTSLPFTLVDGTSVLSTTQNGFLTTAGRPTYLLNLLSAAAPSKQTNGYVGIFDPKTNLSLAPATPGTACCPFVLAGSAIYGNDNIGPFKGGYQETNKSKMINPKYISRMYTVQPCAPKNEILHIGSTYWTAGEGVLTGVVSTPGVGYTNSATAIVVKTVAVTGTGSGLTLFVTIAGGVPTVTGIASLGKSYTATDTVTITPQAGVPGTLAIYTISTVTAANVDVITGSGGASCCKEFMCGETYNLRVDIKGSPVLRYLERNTYYTAEAYTGCCPADAIAPVAVDSTTVFINWANGILNYALINPFLQIVIQDETGLLWYAPGTSAADLAIAGGNTWNNYVSNGHIDGKCAGMIFNGAYVDTKFGDCTFQISDFYETEPVKLYASELDLNGNPCEFEGLCIVHQCLATQANGLGETVLRDITLSESYRQNFLHSDLRIREITQGNQIVEAINRNSLYWGSYIQHSVPRHSNPSGTFDSDQYLLQIVSLVELTAFNTLADAIQDGCGLCDFEKFTCSTACSNVIYFPATPLV